MAAAVEESGGQDHVSGQRAVGDGIDALEDTAPLPRVEEMANPPSGEAERLELRLRDDPELGVDEALKVVEVDVGHTAHRAMRRPTPMPTKTRLSTLPVDNREVVDNPPRAPFWLLQLPKRRTGGGAACYFSEAGGVKRSPYLAASSSARLTNAGLAAFVALRCTVTRHRSRPGSRCP